MASIFNRMKKLKEYKNSKKAQNVMNKTHDAVDILNSNMEGPRHPSKNISHGILLILTLL